MDPLCVFFATVTGNALPWFSSFAGCHKIWGARPLLPRGEADFKFVPEYLAWEPRALAALTALRGR